MNRIGLAIAAAVLLAAQSPPTVPREGNQQAVPTAPVTVTGREPQMPPSALTAAEPGYEAAPVSTRTVPLGLSAAEHPSLEKERRDRELDSWWTLFFVGLAAIATAVLVIVSIAQAGFFWVQLRMMRKSLDDTTTVAQAAKEQSEIARREYIASNRPKLRVRLISVEIPPAGQRFRVKYEVVNVGGTRAQIIDNEVTVRVVHGNAALGAQEATERRQIPFANELRQGEALPAQGEVLLYEPGIWELDHHAPGEWWENRLFVIGIIRYSDDNGVVRRTAFYRMASQDLKRFRLPNFDEATFADREYED